MSDDLPITADRPDTTLALILRRWSLVALCAVVGAAVAVALAQMQPPEYRATASILQTDSDLSSALAQPGDSQQIARTTMTATELIRLPVITERAASQI